MTKIIKSEERGHSKIDWLDSRHSFSFADYYDPEHMGFRSLRVINDDWIGPGGGFPTHPHRDMEILTYVLEGAVGHRDSMGNGSTIRPGNLQRMSAGSGITHSEFNASSEKPLHLYQIWILPDRRGLKPEYEELSLTPGPESDGGLRLVASPEGGAEVMAIHQDARVHIGTLKPGRKIEHAIAPGRGVWVQILSGSVRLNGGSVLAAGDAVAIEDEAAVALAAEEESQVMLFDLA